MMSHSHPPFPSEPEFRRFLEPTLIARGRVADVYRARDGVTGREVAVKVLAGHEAAEAARFLHGAALQARIRHTHVLPIYDAWGGERTAQVTAYAHGGTLHAHLEHANAIPLARAADWGLQILAGTAAIHGAGIIHGDLKLMNVLLNHAGQLWISDFGEARAADDPLPPQPQPIINGSPYYMAPECARGYAPDEASDRYSVGVILYRLFCGRLPFVGGDAETVMRMQVADAPVDPRAYRAEIPDMTARFILSLLTKDPKWRPKFDESAISVLSA